MVTIGRVYERLEKYAEDNYYKKSASSPVTWHGKGAEVLGLRGEVTNEDYQAAREGKHPQTGEQLVPPASNGVHRDGYDVQFALPKGLSMLREFGPPEVRDAIDRANNRAIENTMKMIEKDYIYVRQTKDGQTEYVKTGNAVWAKADHDLSRELDMQRHVHCPMMNISYNPNGGKYQAIESKILYNNKMYFGQYYRNDAMYYTREELGKIGYKIEFQTDAKGLYDINIYTQEEKGTNSRRTEQINAKIQELKESGLYQGLNEQKLREIACLGSRAAKKDVDMAMVREDWKERNAEIGITEKTTKERLQQAAEKAKQHEANRIEPKMTEYDVVKQSAKIQTEQESTFSKEDVLKLAGKLASGEYRSSDLEKAFNELNKDKEIKFLDTVIEKDFAGRLQSIKQIYTTKEMLKIEKQNVKTMLKGQSAKDAILSKEQAAESIKAYETRQGFTMTQGQKNAVEHILTSRDRVIGIQGDAGTGKTTSLAVAKEQLEKQGYIVRGLGYTGKAASEIEQSAGIKSQTLHSFLSSSRKADDIVKGKEVWIVDEASMLGSKQTNEILKAAGGAKARVVLIGDTKQLQSISAGRSFADLQARGMRTVKMKEVLRQKDEQYKDIVKDVSEKQIDKALDKLEKQKRIHEIADRTERLNAIVNEYLNSKGNTIIVTARNADRNELNSMLHNGLKEKGKIGKKAYAFTVRESKNLSPESKHFAQSYSEGDRIVASKKNIIGGNAGGEGKVTAIDSLNHRLTVQTKNGKEHTIDLKTQGQNLQVYREKEQAFSKGEKIVFLKNNSRRGILNGNIGTIKSIDEKGNVKVKMENGKIKDLNLKTQYNYADKGYAVTIPKAQGQTAYKVIVNADTGRGVDCNQAYVAMTRGKHDLKVYTNDKENFREQMKIEQSKTSTLDHEKQQHKQQEVQKERGGLSL
jgi:conjugative relaxase-like TrwC/TraI family protein